MPPPKMLLSPGGSGPHLIHGSLHTPESTVQTASRSVQPFQHSSWLWQTDRQTLTARLRYICCSRPHLLLCISICGLKRSVNKRAFVSWQQTVIQYHLRLYHGYLMSHDKQHRTWGLARYYRASVRSDALYECSNGQWCRENVRRNQLSWFRLVKCWQNISLWTKSEDKYCSCYHMS